MNYKVEHNAVYKGLRCAVLLGASLGHRCGYVGIGQDHPLYNINYNEEIPEALKAKWRIIEDTQTTGKRGVFTLLLYDPAHPRVEVMFDVHGSLTYSGGKDNYPVQNSGLWWFGFDCGHCDDAPDTKAMLEYGFTPSPYMSGHGGTVRTLDYCINECHSLADQLLEVAK